MPSATSAGSSSTPFRFTERTVSVTASMKLAAPGVAVNRTVVCEVNTRSPRVRSRFTS